MKRIYLLTPGTWDILGFMFLLLSLTGFAFHSLGMTSEISWRYTSLAIICFIFGSRK